MKIYIRQALLAVLVFMVLALSCLGTEIFRHKKDLLVYAQTNTFCASNLACQVTAQWVFALLNGVTVVDGTTNTSIAAALTSLGANSGIIDNTGCLGTKVISAMNVSANGVVIKLGPCNYSQTGLVILSGNSDVIIGQPQGPSFGTAGGTTITQNTSANLNAPGQFSITGTDDLILDVIIDGNVSGNSSAGPIISCTGQRFTLSRAIIQNGNSNGLSAGSSSTPDLCGGLHIEAGSMLVTNKLSNLLMQQMHDVFLDPGVEYENSTGGYGVEARGVDGIRMDQDDVSGNALGGFSCIGTSSYSCTWDQITNTYFGENQGNDIQFINSTPSLSTDGSVGHVIANNHFLGLSNGTMPGPPAAMDNTWNAIYLKDTYYTIVSGNVTQTNPSPYRYKYCIDDAITVTTANANSIQNNNCYGSFGTGTVQTNAYSYYCNNISNGTQGDCLFTNIIANGFIKMPNSVPFYMKNSSGAYQSIFQLGADNNTYFYGDSTQQQIHFQPNPGGTDTLYLTATGIYAPQLINGCVQLVSNQFTSTGSNCNPVAALSASLSTTAATSDSVTVTGMTSSGHCSLAATNSSAATNLATTYISAKATNSITVAHIATASMTFDILCTPN